MNRHFEDSLYYLKRAGETATYGLSEEIEPVERKVREVTGYEKEPEPTGVEAVRAELIELEARAEGKAREKVASARETFETYRPGA